jgi:hypothetical protein
MLISRLLPFSILIAVGAATVAAQSSPEKSPIVIQSTDAGHFNSSASPDLPFIFPNLKAEQDQPEPMDRIRIGEYSPRLSQFGVPHTLLSDPDGQPLDDDTLCYTMRSFKVARDNPQSDSTHAAGSSTCQPAARFHVHSIELRASPSAP